jgi:hypothetical protein
VGTEVKNGLIGVIDGFRRIHKAVKAVFDSAVEIQCCQVPTDRWSVIKRRVTRFAIANG